MEEKIKMCEKGLRMGGNKLVTIYEKEYIKKPITIFNNLDTFYHVISFLYTILLAFGIWILSDFTGWLSATATFLILVPPLYILKWLTLKRFWNKED